MAVLLEVEPLLGALPSLVWRWDPETDILSGSFDPGAAGDGLTGTVELSDEGGAIAVLDLTGGALAGLDMVVWPEVATVAGLHPPEGTRDGRVMLPGAADVAAVGALEVDDTLAVRTDTGERIFHVQFIGSRPRFAVRVADNLLVEVGEDDELAGFWLTGVPAFPAGEDY
jgi:hypothetical protein